ncbi:hypothetical protein [Arthrobacter ruber]|uniref:hypothetical protein n=1 Tax=Arthrobacter ruber TaxID=1258893 RepID=UPI000CF3A3F4|nr:hypothetical protein [Arthrobacter ruber]
MPGVALFTDVDEAIAPFTHTADMEMIDTPGHGATAFRLAIVGRLAALPARQVWLSARGQDAPGHLGRLLPRAADALESGFDDSGWWKIDAALAWLEQNPDIRRVAWIDDELSEEDTLLGLSFKEIAQEAFAEIGVQSLLVVPDSFTGATHEEVDTMEQFIAGADTADFELTVIQAPETPVQDMVVVEEPIPVTPVVEAAPDEWGFTGFDTAAAPSPAPAAPSAPASQATADDDDLFARRTTPLGAGRRRRRLRPRAAQAGRHRGRLRVGANPRR